MNAIHRAAQEVIDALDARDADRAALFEQPAQQQRNASERLEPVALQMDVIVVNLVREGINKHRARELAQHFIKHTSPPASKPWVGLTDAELGIVSADIWGSVLIAPQSYQAFARAIETKLREKNA